MIGGNTSQEKTSVETREAMDMEGKMLRFEDTLLLWGQDVIVLQCRVYGDAVEWVPRDAFNNRI